MSWIPSKKHLDFVLAEESGEGVANTLDKERKGPPISSLLNIKKPLVWTHILEQAKNIVSLTSYWDEREKYHFTHYQIANFCSHRFLPKNGRSEAPRPGGTGRLPLESGLQHGEIKGLFIRLRGPLCWTNGAGPKKDSMCKFFCICLCKHPTGDPGHHPFVPHGAGPKVLRKALGVWGQPVQAARRGTGV